MAYDFCQRIVACVAPRRHRPPPGLMTREAGGL